MHFNYRIVGLLPTRLGQLIIEAYTGPIIELFKPLFTVLWLCHL
jgi:hypothetical protein